MSRRGSPGDCLSRFRVNRAGIATRRYKTAKDSQAALKRLEGTLVTRVAMGVDVLARLHQQIQHVLVSMRDARQPKQKA